MAGMAPHLTWGFAADSEYGGTLFRHRVSRVIIRLWLQVVLVVGTDVSVQETGLWHRVEHVHKTRVTLRRVDSAWFWTGCWNNPRNRVRFRSLCPKFYLWASRIHCPVALSPHQPSRFRYRVEGGGGGGGGALECNAAGCGVDPHKRQELKYTKKQ